MNGKILLLLFLSQICSNSWWLLSGVFAGNLVISIIAIFTSILLIVVFIVECINSWED